MKHAGIYGDLEVALHRSPSGAYDVELRLNDSETDAEIAPEKGQAGIVTNELLPLQEMPEQYGDKLAAQLFQDDNIRQLYGKAKAAFESGGRMLRLRVLIGPSAPELHSLRWELLRDPETHAPLATSERILFSRFMLSRDWRAVKLRPKAELKAVIAVSAPSDVTAYQLAAVDKDGEVERAREGLAGIQAEVVGKGGEALTLQRLVDSLRPGIDILYLVCHGVLTSEMEPYLFLQNEDGKTARVKGSDLAVRISELAYPPRLIVLASCESAGKAGSSGAMTDKPAMPASLAPRLAEAGVPAVLAMQGKISMETVKLAMPVFFRELVKDGQVDLAMARARGAVRERADSWMPALFLRVKSGRIWYEPGFAGDDSNDFEKWKTLCHSVRQGRFVPVLGPELAEDLFGGTGELANRLAEGHAFPLASHQRTDLAKVSQFISTHQDRTYTFDTVQDQFLHQLAERANGACEKTREALLDWATQTCASNAEHPYHILAHLPAAIYLNASYEPLLTRALRAAGKNPEAIITAWRRRGVEVPKQPQPKNPRPAADIPWVYHIFGLFGKPDTMVLTEDDFFDYLIETSRLDLLLPTLVGRLMQNSLIFLGFRLDDWRFRVLFRMIITRQGTETMRELSHVGVQVNPDEQSFADVERTRKYMNGYFRGGRSAPEISIYWGSCADFLKQLKAKLTEPDEAPKTFAAAAGGNDWL